MGMNKSDANKYKARAYFGILGQTDLVLHHKDTSLKKNDYERYIQWNVEDLVVMTRAEHTYFHRKGHKASLEVRQRISAGKKGKRYGKYTKERCRKISDALKGRKLSEKHIESLKEAQRNRSEEDKKRFSEANSGANNPMFGKHHTDEARKKMSDSLKGNTRTKGWTWKLVDGKRVYQRPNNDTNKESKE